MKEKATFSNKRVLFIFGVIGLLLGVMLAGVLLTGRPASAQTGAAQTEAITADDAKAVVEEANPGATVTEVERDDSGRNAYEVELDNGAEIIVDAVSGEIIATGNEVEDAGGDDGEDADNDQRESEGQ